MMINLILYNYIYSYIKYNYICKYIFFFLNKCLIKVYTIKDIRHIGDKPQGFIVINGIIISILFSLFVQLLFLDKVSL